MNINFSQTLKRAGLLTAGFLLVLQMLAPMSALAQNQVVDTTAVPTTECYEQVSWWKVGKVYAEDVYTRSWVKDYKTEYKYKKYQWDWNHNLNNNYRTESNVGNTQYGEWDYYSTTGYGSQRSLDVFKDNNDWYKYVLYDTNVVENGGHYEYTKIHTAGDPYVALYGPYKVYGDPFTVPFDVGSGQHIIGDKFDYNQTNYQDNNGKIDYTYKLDSQGVENGKRIPCAKPADKVEYTEWEDGTPNCETKTVTPARTKTVTPYVLAQDGFTWVAGTPVVTSESGEPRSLTPEELKDCTPGPDSKVTYGDWTDSEWNCGDTKVVQTRTKTVTPYMWDGEGWVEDSANASTSTDSTTQTRDLSTEESLQGCTGNISGFKLNDRNGNALQDEGEEKLAGWTIQLWGECEVEENSAARFLEINSAVVDEPQEDCFEAIDETVTDADGNYAFTNLPDGAYVVCEVPQAGWTRTFPADSDCHEVSIDEGEDCIANFANKQDPGKVLGTSTPPVVPPVLANTGTPLAQGMLIGMSILGAAGGITYLSRRKQYQA